jgi:hypothetical protein
VLLFFGKEENAKGLLQQDRPNDVVMVLLFYVVYINVSQKTLVTRGVD